jgi:hypothetical protein
MPTFVALLSFPFRTWRKMKSAHVNERRQDQLQALKIKALQITWEWLLCRKLPRTCL